MNVIVFNGHCKPSDGVQYSGMKKIWVCGLKPLSGLAKGLSRRFRDRDFPRKAGISASSCLRAFGEYR